MNLTVIEQFADHAIGDIITDAKAVEAILASEFSTFVVKVLGPPEAPEASESTDKNEA